MTRRFRFVFVILLLASTTVSTWAQGTNATIRGSVRDEMGNAFPTAEVVAVNTETGFTARAVAGPRGNFVLPGLTPGSYRLTVTAPSYTTSTRDVRVLIGQSLEVDFALRPDMVLTEEVTVVGSAAVETETSEIATNVTRQQIEGLPQNDRNFLNFAALAPGVLLGTDEFRKEVRAGALGSSSTNVFIDGVSFKNDVIQGGVVGQDASRGNPFPQNAVQEFRVITQNYSAEYQKASSAIITAITRSGTNRMSGDVFFLWQDRSLVDENPLTGADPEYERQQYGISLGGPIVRDRAHYFLSYEANDQTREETVSLGGGFQNDPELREQLARYTGTYASPFRSDLGFAKLTFQLRGNQLLEWSGTIRDESDIRGFGNARSREAAQNVNNDVFGTNLRHQYTATSWLNEASLSYQDFKWNPTPLDQTLVGREYEGLIRIGGSDTEQDIGQQRIAFRDDLTFSGLQFGGDHTLKVGGNADFLDYTVRKEFTSNPVYYFRSDISSTIPYKARWGSGNPDMSAENEQFGLYVQDEWSVNERLTMNLGLRWDYETNMVDTNYVTPLEVRERLSDQFPAKFFTDGNDRDPATDLFQPRLGLTYDLFADGRTVLFGGAGRYYDRNLFNNTLDERFRLQYMVGEFFFSEDGSDMLGQPAVAWDPRYFTPEGLNQVRASGRTGRPEVFLIENDTEVPFSDQFNVGVRQSFGRMVGAISYANIRSENGFSFLWGAGYCCPQYDPAYSNVLISSDDIRTWYDAVYVTLDRPFTGDSNYGFNIAYTWADAEQVGGDLFSLDLPTISDWPRYGTPGTQDHRIVANGMMALPFDVRLGALLQYSSGDKFRIHNRERGFCADCYEPLTGEGPSWTTVDLRLDKDFMIANSRIGISLEAFNVTNEKRYGNFVAFNPPEGNPNLGRPTSIVGGSQRRYQLGIRYGF